MDTTTNNLQKQAAPFPAKTLVSIPNNLLKSYLTWAAALGILGGTGVGLMASTIKAKNDKITSLDRKKKFYTRHIAELENENWLNDIMATKKKLDSNRLSEEERAELEKQYLKLLNK